MTRQQTHLPNEVFASSTRDDPLPRPGVNLNFYDARTRNNKAAVPSEYFFDF